MLFVHIIILFVTALRAGIYVGEDASFHVVYSRTNGLACFATLSLDAPSSDYVVWLPMESVVTRTPHRPSFITDGRSSVHQLPLKLTHLLTNEPVVAEC